MSVVGLVETMAVHWVAKMVEKKAVHSVENWAEMTVGRKVER